MVIIIIVLIVIIIMLGVRCFELNELLAIEMRHGKNEAVYWFRRWLALKDMKAYEKLPPYKEMVESDKRITEENYYNSSDGFS